MSGLDSQTVHIWRYRQAVPAELAPSCTELLDPEERRIASRFALSGLRDAYVATHAVLRLVISRYLDEDPKTVEFHRRPGGKPVLAPKPGMPALKFNLSHSGDMVLCGLALDRELGVDVERIRGDRDVTGIARRNFSPRELAELRSIEGPRHVEAFYAGWVRKEAYLKARGDGLAQRLDSFDVTIDPGRGAALLRSEAGPEDAARWAMSDVPVPRGYAAAVAVERRSGARSREADEPSAGHTEFDSPVGGVDRLILLDLRYEDESSRPRVMFCQQRFDGG